MVNFAASAPPVMEKVTTSPALASVAVTIVTAFVFSVLEIAAVAPRHST